MVRNFNLLIGTLGLNGIFFGNGLIRSIDIQASIESVISDPR